MVDGRAFVQILQYVLILLKVRIDLNFTIFYEIQSIGWLMLCKYHSVFIVALWLKAEHQVKKHLVVVISQILHSSKHFQQKFNLLVSIGLDCVLFK